MNLYRGLIAATTTALVGAAVAVAITIRTIGQAIDNVPWPTTPDPDRCPTCRIRPARSLAGHCYHCEETALIQRLEDAS